MTRSADAPVVLLVEDDRRLAGMLAELLDEEGYHTDVAYDGQSGLHKGLTRRHDVLILDRGLPVMDGIDLLLTLRGHGVTAPALVLTARGALADRVEGLDAGAEDYLVKPFDVPELLARLRVLLRRHPDATQARRVGRWRLDPIGRTVIDENALFTALADSPNQVFSRRQLLATVFDTADTPGTVDTYVHYLRRKLGKQIVHTVHGVGYRLGDR